MIRSAMMTNTLRSRLSAFRRSEDGSLIMFVLLLFVLMLMLGGLAVDLMRYEQRRTALQQTIDRSVLAAASLTQDLDPESVVNDYFDKAKLREYLRDVTVTEGLNFRNVDATAHADLDPFFTHMVGIDEFDVPAASQAEQRINNVEIVMVLDVSGSMLSNNRLVNLKTAANEFVDQILGNDPEDRISISLVPFNGQVNLGATLRSKFNATNLHGTANVNCVDLPSSVYNSVTLSRTTALPMTAHADTFTSTNQSTSYVAIEGHTMNANNKPSNNWCPPSTGNTVTVMATDATALKARINAMEGIGATSINAGLRWGLTLMDPAQRPLMTELGVPFVGRPFDWTDEEAMKVIILMTDGEHFKEERVNNTYKTGTSPIWYNSNTNTYVIQHTTGRPTAAGTKQYWQPNLCTSTNCRNGSDTSQAWVASVPSGYTQQTWQQVWSRARVSWVAWQLYARALGKDSGTTSRTNIYNTWIGNFRSQTETNVMDAQLRDLCTLAKQKKVLIYGIAFEAPANGQAAIQGCASYYFETYDDEIRDVFRAIASNISQLRLTQ